MPEIANFQNYLTSINGRLKAPQVAKAITTDISKFLKFCRPAAPLPDWSVAYHRQSILDYLEHFKTVGGCSHESQLAQLESISHALRYVQCRLLSEDDSSNNTCRRVEVDLQAWKASLRKQKALRSAERQQEFLENPGSLQEVTDFTECVNLWRKFDSVVKAIKSGKRASPRECNFCTVSVAALLLFLLGSDRVRWKTAPCRISCQRH